MSNTLKEEIEKVKFELDEQIENALTHEQDDELMTILRTKLNILIALYGINELHDHKTNLERMKKERTEKKQIIKTFKINSQNDKITKKMSNTLINDAIRNNKLKIMFEYSDDLEEDDPRYINSCISKNIDDIDIKILKEYNNNVGAIFSNNGGYGGNHISEYIDDEIYNMIIETLNDKNDKFEYKLYLILLF
jgi:hypothetical protein